MINFKVLKNDGFFYIENVVESIESIEMYRK